MTKLNELSVRYGMTPSGFERLLVEIGWMKDGEVCGGPYIEAGRVTARGLGFLDGYLGRR